MIKGLSQLRLFLVSGWMRLFFWICSIFLRILEVKFVMDSNRSKIFGDICSSNLVEDEDAEAQGGCGCGFFLGLPTLFLVSGLKFLNFCMVAAN